ncbi:glutamine synthetase [Sinanaerobacter chloroacetimidivorans]|uniref:glutamine synthetase n=1 Tax=Sinanaerobacter chloroacetimidivorans TaxID=2818044 RepID=A0A8J7W026_9FIRM|nr:glutamine synthetase [Sinanaerobacter chloroacetimidivorans]MBR0597874.1 glutamine synthetase [Sinanaerobacter chloroacetimidivorans]
MIINRMLFNIPAENHTVEEITELLSKHQEVKFVSLVGIDIGGHDTDEKIPVELFIKDMEKFLSQGVQTDGSSVVLPKIAELNNAKVDIIPDLSVNWYVDYNFNHVTEDTKLPVGTLRIPSFLVHNDTFEVGSRVILRDTVKAFKIGVRSLLEKNPYVFDYLEIDSIDEIDDIVLTAATELEFWVKTPDDKADREQLSTSQILKEQYWKRTIGPVRTALEKSLLILDRYGFNIEMGHKEVGGIKAKLGTSGEYDHVMEQLEIDWGYSTALQAADNENQVKYVVRDVFRAHGLDVTFMAKPMEGVAGNGEHTHIGVAAKLKNGKIINLFAPKNMEEDYLNPIGFGALLGILKNYEVMNPFIASSNDALNRLKPGFEAPVCIVTSIGHTAKVPSRNRTVLVGLVRDINNPLSTRFELRSPNPKSNTYLVLATAYLAMLDGITAALEAGKTTKELEGSLSKKYGKEDFYLETRREYRSEKDVFDEYSEEERDKLFGKVPATVWENISAFREYPDKLKILMKDGVMDNITLESYEEATVGAWATELHNRIIPNTMALVRECKKMHPDNECTDYDVLNWTKIQKLRVYLGQDQIEKKSLLTRIKLALDSKNYNEASDLQIEMQSKIEELVNTYMEYKKNLL